MPAEQGESSDSYTSHIRILNLNSNVDRLLASSGRKGEYGELKEIFWSPDRKWIASYFGEQSSNNPLVGVPTSGGPYIVYLDSLSRPTDTHSPEVKVLRHSINGAVTKAWHYRDFQWMPD